MLKTGLDLPHFIKCYVEVREASSVDWVELH